MVGFFIICGEYGQSLKKKEENPQKQTKITPIQNKPQMENIS